MMQINRIMPPQVPHIKVTGSFRKMDPKKPIPVERINPSGAGYLTNFPKLTKGHKSLLDLSVIIPAYNEENRLPVTLRTTLGWLSENLPRFELIVVDDGSQDRTRQVVDYYAKLDPRVRLTAERQNRGKGYSVREGVLLSQGRLVLYMDADNSTPISEIEKFYQALDQGAQVVIGSRALAASQILVHQPWYRETMGKTFNLLVRLFAVRGINDTQCGFKLFTREAADTIFPRQRIKGFSFDVELLFLAQRFGFKIAEVPICWENSPESRVHILFDAVKMFWDLLKIRFYHWGKPTRKTVQIYK